MDLCREILRNSLIKKSRVVTCLISQWIVGGCNRGCAMLISVDGPILHHLERYNILPSTIPTNYILTEPPPARKNINININNNNNNNPTTTQQQQQQQQSTSRSNNNNNNNTNNNTNSNSNNTNNNNNNNPTTTTTTATTTTTTQQQQQQQQHQPQQQQQQHQQQHQQQQQQQQQQPNNNCQISRILPMYASHLLHYILPTTLAQGKKRAPECKGTSS